MFGAQNAWGRWVGNSAINANWTWYYAGSDLGWGDGDHEFFNGANLGNITTLTLGGQSQVWTGNDWTGGTMKMYYSIDGGSSQEITLTYYGYWYNNNFLQSGGSEFSAESIDLSGLSEGAHTIAVWFLSEDEYDNNGGSNYVATFYIASSVTLNSFGYATFCGANNYEVSGATAYKAALSGDVLTLSEISGVIPAGVGIILGGTAGATATISYTGEDATTVSGNVLQGTTSSQTTTSLYSEGQTFYAYDKSDNKFKIYNGTNFPANKAYFIVESGAGSAPSAIRIEFEENNVTSIDAIGANEKAVKFIENGKLFILKNGVVFDAIGNVVR